MNKLLDALRAYEKSGEELANIASVAALENKLNLSVEEGRELMDRCMKGEMDGARAERAILEAVALKKSMEIVKRNLALNN